MVVLVDTNIIIDALANREPYADNAKKILEKCAAREVTGILAAHSIPNMFYIFRKNFSQDERRFLLKNLCNIFKISDLNAKKILAALENEKFVDFEDCLQEECAIESMADYIVTRNPADFANSRVKVILPEEFLKKL
ncbi:MAG: type II toxin-antitoxin system VapC family toxin [Lachnospiraceae bacterium]